VVRSCISDDRLSERATRPPIRSSAEVGICVIQNSKALAAYIPVTCRSLYSIQRACQSEYQVAARKERYVEIGDYWWSWGCRPSRDPRTLGPQAMLGNCTCRSFEQLRGQGSSTALSVTYSRGISCTLEVLRPLYLAIPVLTLCSDSPSRLWSSTIHTYIHSLTLPQLHTDSLVSSTLRFLVTRGRRPPRYRPCPATSLSPFSSPELRYSSTNNVFLTSEKHFKLHLGRSAVRSLQGCILLQDVTATYISKSSESAPIHHPAYGHCESLEQ